MCTQAIQVGGGDDARVMIPPTWRTRDKVGGVAPTWVDGGESRPEEQVAPGIMERDE
jgi:hypothetical protein